MLCCVCLLGRGALRAGKSVSAASLLLSIHRTEMSSDLWETQAQVERPFAFLKKLAFKCNPITSGIPSWMKFDV